MNSFLVSFALPFFVSRSLLIRRSPFFVDSGGWPAGELEKLFVRTTGRCLSAPAFLGAGILSGVNASVSLYAGGILAWGILGPILMATGQTVARDFSAQYQDYPVLNYSRMSFTDPVCPISAPLVDLS